LRIFVGNIPTLSKFVRKIPTLGIRSYGCAGTIPTNVGIISISVGITLTHVGTIPTLVGTIPTHGEIIESFLQNSTV